LKVIWSPLAIDRAVEQARVIAEDKPGAAERWLEGVFAATETMGAIGSSIESMHAKSLF